MTPIPPSDGRIKIALATERDRQTIYRLRHEVYARELAQHEENPQGSLSDPLDAFNTYITAKSPPRKVEPKARLSGPTRPTRETILEDSDRLPGGEIAGFISITPPGHQYSVEKYLSRSELPFAVDKGLYEVRLLTVVEHHRARPIAPLLMYAALRWIEARGGRRIVAIGRKEAMSLYLGAGLVVLDRRIRSGAVTFELMTAEIEILRRELGRRQRLLDRLERTADWRLDIPFQPTAACFHGGGFFDAVGTEFDRLENSRKVINADVLDAWFPPSPRVLEALRAYLGWIARTSPPTDSGGMISTVARLRGVPEASVLPGAGSSSLIYLAFRHWLTRSSRALILDPTYGEYAHILERVIGCRTDRLTLPREGGFVLDPDRLARRLADDYDLIVLVNPNSPTGRYVPREDLEDVLDQVPAGTRVWIDETYVEYAGTDRSLERFASRSEGVIVCKSLSKVYALSGLRAAYLCAPPHQLEALRQIQPPWAVSLPAQVAAVKALEDPVYYRERYRQTITLRQLLVRDLRASGAMEVVPSTTNFVLCRLHPDRPRAAELIERCRAEGLFLRAAGDLGTGLGARDLRIAIKDAETNGRMLGILGRALDGDQPPAPVPLDSTEGETTADWTVPR